MENKVTIDQMISRLSAATLDRAEPPDYGPIVEALLRLKGYEERARTIGFRSMPDTPTTQEDLDGDDQFAWDLIRDIAEGRGK